MCHPEGDFVFVIIKGTLYLSSARGLYICHPKGDFVFIIIKGNLCLSS